MFLLYLFLVTVFLVLVGAWLIVQAMRRYRSLHAMFRVPWFTFEIDGEAEQLTKDAESEPKEEPASAPHE